MPADPITLRKDPEGKQTYGLTESANRFVVHFKTSLLGGSAVKAALRLPLMFGRRVHARKLPLPPRLALFELRPDEAARHVPGYGDDVLALRDAEVAPYISYQRELLLHRQDQSEAFRYGELVALSGNFYATPEELYWERPSCVLWLWEENDLSDMGITVTAPGRMRDENSGIQRFAG